MRKLYPRIFLGLFAMLFSCISFAQVSVTATAGTTGPTAYTTLQAAFDAIVAGTHQGAVTVSITGNTTETSSDSLVASGTGSASYTSILVKPAAGVNATITGTVATSLLVLNGADNVTIDGSNTAGGTTRNLTFVNNDANGNTVRFTNGSSNNVIKNAILKGGSSGSSVILMATSTGAAGNSSNTIENNEITKSATNPGAGIFNIGSSGAPNSNNVYRNNKISDFTLFGFIDGTGTAGGTNGFSTNTTFEGNEIFHTGPVSTTLTSTSITGIFIGNFNSISNMNIVRNRIHSIQPASANYTTLVGIDLYDATSVNVVNNMISLSSPTLNIRALAQETGAPAVIKIYNNTVLVHGNATAGASFALLKNYTSTGDDIRNNIFVNNRVTTSANKQYAFSKSSTGTFTSNYNNYYAFGNAQNVLGAIATTDYATLAAWQAASSGDANSVSIDPVFVSTSDLHLSTAANASLDNKGTPIAAVTIDIDGDTRNATTPDLGADEFTATTACTAPAITTQPAAQTVCGGAAINLSVTATGTALTYQWRKGGTNIAGATNATYSIASAATGDAGNYDVVISNTCGTVTSTAVAVAVNAATAITTQPASVTACQGNATFTVAATGAGLTYQWRFNGTNIPGATASTLSVPVTAVAGGAYSVVVTGTCGNVTSGNATLTVQNCTSVPNVDADITSMTMMPNLVKDATTLRVVAARTMKLNWNVVDAQGKVVMTISRQVMTGKNDIALYLGQLANGTYHLQGTTDKGITSVIRFVKH